MRNRGFTLLEVLVAAAIGVALLTLAISAFIGVRRIAERNRVLVAAHDVIANTHRALARDLAATVHTAKWELSAQPGADGAWNTGDETLALTWMATVTDPSQVHYDFARKQKGDILWCRFRWSGGGTDAAAVPPVRRRSAFEFGRNSGYRQATWLSGGSSRFAYTTAMHRRDRRRDLDDNDLRFIPGLSGVNHAIVGMKGDAADLEEQMLGLVPPRFTITDVRISLVDRGGAVTTATATAGIQRVSGPALGGGSCESANLYAIDGMYLDARAATVPGSEGSSPGAERTVADMRPLLVRIDFIIREYPESGEAIVVPVNLSFPTGPQLPPW